MAISSSKITAGLVEKIQTRNRALLTRRKWGTAREDYFYFYFYIFLILLVLKKLGLQIRSIETATWYMSCSYDISIAYLFDMQLFAHSLVPSITITSSFNCTVFSILFCFTVYITWILPTYMTYIYGTKVAGRLGESFL